MNDREDFNQTPAHECSWAGRRASGRKRKDGSVRVGGSGSSFLKDRREALRARWQMQKGSSSVKSPVTVWRPRGIPCKGAEFAAAQFPFSSGVAKVVEYRPVFSDVEDGLFAQFRPRSRADSRRDKLPFM